MMVTPERSHILQSKKTIEKRRGCGIGRSYYMFEDNEEKTMPKCKKGPEKGRPGRPRRKSSVKECKHACNSSMKNGIDGVKKSLCVLTKGLSRTNKSEKGANRKEKRTKRVDSSGSGHGQKEEHSADVLYYDSYVQFMSGSSPKS